MAAELSKVKVEAWKEKSLGNLMFDRFDGANEKKKIVFPIRIYCYADPDPGPNFPPF